MIKFTASGPGEGKKSLFLGLSRRNLELLAQDRPIKITTDEVGVSHDIWIFFGETEQGMVDMLVASGLDLSEVPMGRHHDDDRQESGEN